MTTMSKPSKVPRGRRRYHFAFAQMFYEILKWMNDLDCPFISWKIFQQGVCHGVALPPFTLKKKYLKAKEELWKFKYGNFTLQKYNPSKKVL